MSYRLHELSHRTIIVAFQVQMVSVLPMYISYTRIIQVLRLGDVEREREVCLAIEHIKFVRGALFLKT